MFDFEDEGRYQSWRHEEDYYYDDYDYDDDHDYPDIVRTREVSLANGERWQVILWESTVSKRRWVTREPVIYGCWDGQLPF